LRTLVGREGVRHVGEECRSVDEVLPRDARVLHDLLHVVEARTALRLDVLGQKPAGGAEYDARDLLRAASARDEVREEAEVVRARVEPRRGGIVALIPLTPLGLSAQSRCGRFITSTLVILIGLFYFQQFGAARIDVAFGPVMVPWLSVLAVLGVFGIMRKPDIIAAGSRCTRSR
jgi:hypothetical protein